MLQNLKDFVLIKNANVIKALKCSTENSEIIKSSRTKLKNAEKSKVIKRITKLFILYR